MRAIARARGLPVVEPCELRGLKGSFDGMIASYVLHLAVPEADLMAAVRCMRLSGRIAANFHKSCGVARVTRLMHGCPNLVEVTEERRTDLRHGSIRVWQRDL